MDGLTVQKYFRDLTKRFAERDHLGFRPFVPNQKKRGPYQYIKFKETAELATFVGSGLRQLGLQTGDRIGMWSKNCTEWMLTDFATAVQSFVLVPVYDTFGQRECEYIINHSEMRACVCTQDKVGFLSMLVSQGLSPNLKYIIMINDPSMPDQSLPDGATHRFSDIMTLGKLNVVDDVIAQPDDLYTIVYTSGTTGNPKGVMLSHNNICAGAIMLQSRYSIIPDYQDAVLSYLPLAHVFERVLEMAVSGLGTSIGYYSGEMSMLTDDLGACKPTILCGVPRVFHKTYSKVLAKIEGSPWYKRWIFNAAFRSKLNSMRKGEEWAAWTDKLVFNQIKDIMGGRVRLCFNGSAALPSNVSEFLSTCLGVIIGVGYGLTETSATVTCSEWPKFDLGNSGVPYINSQVCLESVKDMDYMVTDVPYPRGEVLARGPSIFIGYYKDEESYHQCVDADGWFHTGDIGTWVPGLFLDDDGNPQESLRIIDRKKNIFKLSQGEFICAERIETILVDTCEYVRLMIVYAPSSASALVAFVLPDWGLVISERRASETNCTSWASGPAIRQYWKDLATEQQRYKDRKEASAAPAAAAAVSLQADGAVSFSSSSSSSSNPPPLSPAAQAVATAAATGEDPIPPLGLRTALAADEGCRAFVLGAIEAVCLKNPEKIKKFEIPKGIVLAAEEWDENNGLLTPSMKVRRENIKVKYAKEFEVELKKIEQITSSKDVGKRKN